MKKNMKLKGFTLIETILVCILTFMILACAFTILTPMRNIYKETYNTKDSMDVNNFVGEAIERDLRYATRLYVFNGFHEDDDESFMANCVDGFRQDFLFKSNPGYSDIKKRIFGNEETDDIVYVMKIDCKDNDSDGKSRGYVSRYQFNKGVLSSVDSKINFVNPVLYDDRNNHNGYTIDYQLGFKDMLKDGTIEEDEFNPGNLSIVLTTYKSKLDSITAANGRSTVVPDFEDIRAQQVISFPLVNIAMNGSILFEKIPYEKDDGTMVSNRTIKDGTAGGNSLMSVSRFKYYAPDSLNLPGGISSSSTGNEIYFVYTLLNIPE